DYMTNKYDYNPSEHSVTVTDSAGAKVTSFYDTNARLIKSVGPTRTQIYDYDDDNNVTNHTVIELDGTFTEQKEFNQLNQLTRVLDNAGQAGLLKPRLDGAILTRTDRENHSTTNAFTI